MAEHANLFPISKMSKVFRVSKSGYYSWLSREPSKRSQQDVDIRRRIGQIWKQSHKRYGSPRVHRHLKAEGVLVSRPRVARIMKHMGIASRIRKRWVKTTQSNHKHAIVPNLLNRRFNPGSLNQAWVSDITYIPANQGWLYLTTVMDLCDRKIIGWSLSQSMTARETTVAALKQAKASRKPGKDLIFHSDQGRQYACEEFKKELGKHITQSMSRKGNCWDNAPAESFFKTLKYELNMPRAYSCYNQARSALFEFIEIWYNRKRLHSALGYQSPLQVEENIHTKQAA